MSLSTTSLTICHDNSIETIKHILNNWLCYFIITCLLITFHVQHSVISKVNSLSFWSINGEVTAIRRSLSTQILTPLGSNFRVQQRSYSQYNSKVGFSRLLLSIILLSRCSSLRVCLRQSLLRTRRTRSRTCISTWTSLIKASC
jgi:hypothetical protein